MATDVTDSCCSFSLYTLCRRTWGQYCRIYFQR